MKDYKYIYCRQTDKDNSKVKVASQKVFDFHFSQAIHKGIIRQF